MAVTICFVRILAMFNIPISEECTPTDVSSLKRKTPIAPWKTRKATKRGRLFERHNDHLTAARDKIVGVLDSVLVDLDKYKYLEDFVAFFQLVATKSYPLTCIALPCWLDTVKWYASETTSHMVYREETKLFWRVVYKLLHGSAIRFFSGVESIGQVLSGEANRGQINPQDSDINFAVLVPANLDCKMALTCPKFYPLELYMKLLS